MPNTMPGSLLGLHSALVVVLSALGFAMAVWVYRANPRERENQGFSLMVLFIVSWVSCYHLAQLGDPTFWFRLAAFAVSMFFVTYYFFIVQWFLGKSGRPYRLLGVVILVYGVVMAALALGTDFVISGSAIVGSTARPVFGDAGRWAFYGFVIVLTLLINWILIQGVRRIPRGASRQASVLLDRPLVVRRLQHRVQRGAAAGVRRLRVLLRWATIRWHSCWASPRMRS